MSAFDLERFVAAQNPVYSSVLAELSAGNKRSHWMWFIFPQLRGLGRSPMAHRFGISGSAEAQAYLQHEVLGSRLRECTRLVIAVEAKSIESIFGYPDYLKFRSSMTLFGHAAPDDSEFSTALEKYFSGAEDPLTLSLLADREAGEGTSEPAQAERRDQSLD